MKRQDIKVGTRVRPSDRFRGLHHQAGTVIRAGKNLLTVKWDDGSTTMNLKPMHLEPAE